MNEINYDPSPRDVRIFGLLWLLFFGALGGVVIWRVEALMGAAGFLAAAWLISLIFNGKDRLLQLAGVLLPGLFGTIVLDVTVGHVLPYNVAVALWVAAGVGALAIWVVPALGRLIYVGWMLAAQPIGWTVSGLILGAVYYAVLTPVGWCLRIAGYDSMKRKFDPSAESYWIERPGRVEPSRYFRQF